MFLRIYLLVRVIRNNSELYQKRGVIYKSGYIDRGGPPIDALLCLKSFVDKNPGFSLFAVLGLVVTSFSYVTYLVQREGNDAEGITFFQCFWGTVFLLFRGVARFESYDTAGRLVELLVVAAGILTLSFVIALITISMDVKPQETFALQWLTQHKKQEQRKVIAAELIQATWRFSQLRKKAPEEATMEVQIYLEDLNAKHKKFRLDCEIAENLSLDPAHDKLLTTTRKLESACAEINDIKTAQEELLDAMDEISS